MNVAIVLRRRSTPNLFRDLIIDTLGSGLGNSTLLCSGFFQENFRNSFYRASQEGNLIANLVHNHIDITTVGLHNFTWQNSYKNFCMNLRSAGVNISAKVVSSYSWHAKIFILFKNKVPFFGIIGSSNITSKAFGITPKFNYECDVALWDDNIASISPIVKSAIERQSDPHQILITEYRPQENNYISISDRLLNLEKEILSIKNIKDLVY